MKKIVITYLLIVCCYSFLNAKNINIGLFSYQKIHQLKIKSVEGEYILKLNSDSTQKQFIVKTNQNLTINKSNNLIDVIFNNEHYICNKIELYEKANLIIKVKEPQESEYKLINNNHIVFTFFHFGGNKNLLKNRAERLVNYNFYILSG